MFERIMITAPNHVGAVELVYHNEMLIHYSCLMIPYKFRSWYLRNIPTLLGDLKQFALQFKSKGVVVTYEDVTFAEFWELYNHKLNARRCEPLWDKIGRRKRLLAYYRIHEYKIYTSQKRIELANPETYLRNERYMDEAW